MVVEDKILRAKANVMNRIVILSIVCLFLVGTAQAATFTVSVVLDGSDANPSDGVCATAIGNCTLRAAIEEVNAFPGTDFIAFAIPGAGVKTLQPASEYPVISESVTIDGWSQGVGAGGFGVGEPRIEIDGTNAGLQRNGFNITMAGGDIRGLTINRFDGAGFNLDFSGAGGTIIRGCYIGTDSTGTIAMGNRTGISVNTPNNSIGGFSGQGNLISGNSGPGIIIINATATGNDVHGNYIGTDVTGSADLGNGSNGVTVYSSNNFIGGAFSDQRNLISGNDSYGISIFGATASGNSSQPAKAEQCG